MIVTSLPSFPVHFPSRLFFPGRCSFSSNGDAAVNLTTVLTFSEVRAEISLFELGKSFLCQNIVQ